MLALPVLAGIVSAREKKDTKQGSTRQDGES
jgi:hypothetical protein